MCKKKKLSTFTLLKRERKKNNILLIPENYFNWLFVLSKLCLLEFFIFIHIRI